MKKIQNSLDANFQNFLKIARPRTACVLPRTGNKERHRGEGRNKGKDESRSEDQGYRR